MLASQIFSRTTSILNDTYVTYPESQHISYLNDAQQFISQYRPDSKSSTTAVSIAVNSSKQVIPSTARRLISVIRNMGADGITPGKAVRSSLNMSDMNNINPDWHTTANSEVTEYFFDEARPDEYYIYPQPSTTHFLELKTADRPTDITVASDSIDIDEIYAPQLVSWIVYRALSRDGPESPNTQRAELHKQMVYESLGIKSQSDGAISPNHK